MKIRSGFVSNSSSSSFVVVGIKEPIENVDMDTVDGVYLDHEGAFILGTHVTREDDSGHLDDAELSAAELIKMMEDVADEFGVPASEVKLYMGTT